MPTTMVTGLLLVFIVLQESVFLLEARDAEECITRQEVQLLLKEMEEKQEAIISSLKNEIIELKQDKLRFEGEIRDLLAQKLPEGGSILNDKDIHADTRSDGSDQHSGQQSEQITNGIMPADNIGMTPNKTGIKRYLLDGSQDVPGAAFSVTLSTTGAENLGQGQTIHFDKVISNLGNAFDPNTSVFRAPERGWYVFSLTMMTRPNENQELDVMKNGVQVFHCYSQGNEYNTASRTVVFHAEKGDDIWAQSASYAASPNVHGYEHTSFTGFLLYMD